MNRFMFAGVALVFSFSAHPAQAQDLQDLEDLKEPGFWAMGGVGGGSASIECSVCTEARKPSVSFMAALSPIRTICTSASVHLISPRVVSER